MLLAALVTAVLTATGAGDNVVLQVTGMIGAISACVAYMLAEGIADSSGSGISVSGDEKKNGRVTNMGASSRRVFGCLCLFCLFREQ